MIQEIFPHRFNNQYVPNKNIEESDFVLHYIGNSMLWKTGGDDFQLPRKKDLPAISDKTEKTFLFTLDDISCFLLWNNLKTDKSCLIYKEIGLFRTIRQRETAWVSIAGFHLMNWYSRNKFCGKCGVRTQHKPDERALICPDCNTIVYPTIAPAIIVAIICKNKILLVRSPKFPGKWYSLIAGYVDIGESLEEALIREVKEEVGLDVKNIRYYLSQPWPLSGSIMIGFIAEANENQPISIDNQEISEAAWFTRGSLPEYSPSLGIAGEMIGKFDKGEL